MTILNRYRYDCSACYQRIKKGTSAHIGQIRRQVFLFDSAMQAYRKKRSLSKDSVTLAHQLSVKFIRSSALSISDMRRFLIQMGADIEIDFYAYDLFFEFVRLGAIKKLAAGGLSNTQAEALLHMLGEMDDMPREQWMSRVCSGERLLLSDKTYEMMTEKSRAIYREKIAKMAAKAGKTHREMIKILLKKAGNEQKHIGFLLKNEKNTAKKWLYFAALIVSTLLLSGQLYWMCRNIFLTVLSLLPSFFASKIFIGRLMSSLLHNDYLVRLREDSRPVMKAKTCVVIPALLTEDAIEELSQKIEDLYLQNRKANAVFGLLLDLPESDKKTLPGERALHSRAYFCIDRLNHRYGERFFVGIRKRTFSQTQQKYIGADRKRGAIEQLIETILTKRRSVPIYGSKIKKIDYLMILDQDTRPQVGAVNDLVSIACHPIHRPVYGTENRIIGGYGVLVPSVIHDPITGFETAFGRMLLSIHSTFHYPTTHHELYQDLFGAGSFCGKGLIDIKAYDQAVSGRLPREQILSHDLLEGALLRTGYVSDICFAESQPLTVDSFLKREHRWIRGDWQLLKGTEGISLPAIDRYKMWENCCRSLWPIFSGLLVIAAAILAGREGLFLLLAAMMPIIALPYTRLLDQCLTGVTLSHRVRYFSRVLPAFEGTILWSLLEAAMLPFRAINAADAVFRALYRQYVSKKHLLDWTVFAHAEKRTAIFYRPILICAVLNAGLGVLFITLLRWPATLFFAWAGAPALFLLLSHRAPKKRPTLSAGQKEDVADWARQTWGYVNDHLCEEDHYLLPDSEQFSSDVGVTHRTSPTNIGLSMLSVLAARDLKFIDTDHMMDMLTKILNSIEKLERWHGHLYNWYDTRTAQVLPPSYVSTVDSGNFIVCMCVLVQGLEQYRTEHDGVEDLILRLQRQEQIPNFLKLYDRDRQLLYIGYQVSGDRADRGYYDMLMSEARMTSYYLCAKGILPEKHWQALKRNYVADHAHFGLKSWSGTMFEYMMPLMVLPLFEGTEQYEAICFTVQQQQKWAQGRPFGVSESGYYAVDREQFFQYKAIGIPILKQKKDKENDYTVSPYSSFLIMPHFPTPAYQNLRTLERQGMVGKYGFYEALDYTDVRVGDQPKIVASVMAHHSGMSLISCANVLLNDIFVSRFTADREMRAYLVLLQKGLPRRVEEVKHENDGYD